MGVTKSRVQEDLVAAYYKVYVDEKDVTSAIVGEVNVTEQEDYMVSCSFSVEGSTLANSLARFQSVKIFGGSQDPFNQKWLFKGMIKSINGSFPETGVPRMTVNGLGGAWRGANSGGTNIYPSEKCPRIWGRAKELTVRDIVMNILSETYYNFPNEVFIKEKFNKKYTLKNQISQHGNDWQLLKQLARIANCTLLEVPVDTANSEHKIIFYDYDEWVSKGNSTKQVDNSYDVMFRYPERNMTELDVPFVDPEIRKSEIIILDGELNMDVDLNQGSLRIVTSFDVDAETGKRTDKTTLLKTNDKEQIEAYELKNSEFFDKLRQDEHTYETKIVQFSDKLYYNPDSITQQELDFYFNKVTAKENRAVGYDDGDLGTGAEALGWIGYEMTANIIGDVGIVAYRRYSVYGIGKYSTKTNGENKYYIKTINHSLGEDGYRQSILFYR